MRVAGGQTTLALALAGAFAVASCKDKGNAAPVTTPEAGPPSAQVSATPPVDAGVDARAEAASPNLLDLVPAKVAVSSVVQNPRDFPEHLIDGRLDTAWNGKTGDLVGGFIAFRLPKDVVISRIEMTAGFDKRTETVDLFSANHRITKVAVRRDGALLGEFALDPNVRGLQRIPVAGPGGDYQVKVLSTVAGSKPEWRELVVSEFRVLGTPGRERAHGATRVSVGSLDEAPGKIPLVTDHGANNLIFKDAADACAAFQRRVAESRSLIQAKAKEARMEVGPSSCTVVPVGAAFVPDARYKRLVAIARNDGVGSDTSLYVETPRGLAPTRIQWDVSDPADALCTSTYFAEGYEFLYSAAGLRSVRIENGHLVAVLRGVQHLDVDAQGNERPRDGAAWCREDGKALHCFSYDPRYHGHIGPFAISADGALHLQGSREHKPNTAQ